VLLSNHDEGKDPPFFRGQVTKKADAGQKKKGKVAAPQEIRSPHVRREKGLRKQKCNETRKNGASFEK